MSLLTGSVTMYDRFRGPDPWDPRPVRTLDRPYRAPHRLEVRIDHGRDSVKVVVQGGQREGYRLEVVDRDRRGKP